MRFTPVILLATFLLPVARVGRTQETAAQPAQTAPAEATKKPALVDAATYIIGPGDNLDIAVWKEPTLSGVVPVRPDGMISMVLIGDLPASGLTPMKLGSDIAIRLKKYIQDPSVYVVVTAVNSKRVFILGEVQHVGPIPLISGMTPLEAIATAGGLTPFANAKHIYILRGSGASQQKIPFNYKEALKGDKQQTITLLSGDTIVVP